MALPCYLLIVDNLKKLETSSRYNISVIRCLLSSLETHLGHNPLYCLSSALDLSFKLKWCKTKVNQDKVITMIKFEMEKLTSASTSDKHTVESGGSGCSGSNPLTKKRKLFSFMDEESSNASNPYREDVNESKKIFSRTELYKK